MVPGSIPGAAPSFLPDSNLGKSLFIPEQRLLVFRQLRSFVPEIAGIMSHFVRLYSVMVNTLDFESKTPGSSPGTTF